MSSSALIQRVNQLKASLSKELDRPESDIERCSDILTQLDTCGMTLDILSETLIGVVVAKYKSNSDSAISTKAKNLIKKWKTLAKDANSGDGDGGGSSSSKPIPPAQKDNKKVQNTAATADFSSLPPNRKIIAEKFLEVFTVKSSDGETSPDTRDETISLVTLITQVELAIHNYSRNDKTAYTDKARSLLFNIKKNSNLRDEILCGSISAEALVQMRPEQLATVETTKLRQQLIQDLHESRRLDWDQANEGKINEMCGIKGDLLKASLFKCGRCKSEKTTSTQKQTRYSIVF